ncbi:SAV_2336 N-terminal domain-related protein [Streptomyces sp. NPDC006512]|uniref:SAV_2336 N-terminal domain-related protein n=1 Tax=Streptomyces sp. NPDC006512 TaxID=3154307 RepID=UPI0033B73C29
MPAAVPPPPDPEVRALAGLLRAAGLDPSAEELADALWLAARTRPPEPSGPSVPSAPGTGAPAPDAGAGRPPEAPAPEAGTPPEEEPPEHVPPDPEAEDPVRLYAAGPGLPADPDPEARLPLGDALPVRVPGAAALPRILDIQRALRALQRHRPPGPPTRTVLDEAATAEASARALGLVIPVFRPESRREATVRLVMDASPSMAVWQEMFEELRSVCERLGAFRDVQVHRLHRLPDGTPAVGRGPAAGVGLRSGDQLRDPTGRALTMVVSDCAGPLWREGEAQRLLYRWAQCTPCVVVQPLPQRLWSRSWLPTERGVLERTEGGTGGAGGGQRLRFRPDRAPRPGRPTGGLTVPVLPPNAKALGAWARLVAGLGTGPVPAEVGRVLARHPAAPVPLPRTVRPPRELVRRFRASAGPGAVQLAVYLSAAPLTLPVMRLVQRTMLPDSEPSDLAEVLLSGLLRRSGEAPGPWYEFVPGVQDVLLGPLGRDEAALVLKHCSEYVLAHFGRGVRNFPALAVSQLTGVAPTDPEPEGRPAGRLPQAFAHVSAKVVRRYLPGPPEEDPPQGPGTGPEPGPRPGAPAPAGRARTVRAAYDRLADGDARAPHEAAALLRRAVAAPAGPDDPPEEAETALAGALLALWTAQRDPELLDEAEGAVTGLRTPPARFLLGRVLYERALAGGGDTELLAAADREFATAAAAATDPDLRRDCVVRRSRTLIRLSALHADPGPLREARTALEALILADGNPGAPAQDGRALRGGTLRGGGVAGGGGGAGASSGGTSPGGVGAGGAPTDGDAPGEDPGGADSEAGAPAVEGPRGGESAPAESPGGASGAPAAGGASGGSPAEGEASAGAAVAGERAAEESVVGESAVGGSSGGASAGGDSSAEVSVAGESLPGGAPRGDSAGGGAAVGAFPGAALVAGPPDGDAAHPELRLALGRVLLALLPHTTVRSERTALATESAAHLAAALNWLLAGAPARRDDGVDAGGELPGRPGRGGAVPGTAAGPAGSGSGDGGAEAGPAAGPGAGEEPSWRSRTQAAGNASGRRGELPVPGPVPPTREGLGDEEEPAEPAPGAGSGDSGALSGSPQDPARGGGQENGPLEASGPGAAPPGPSQTPGGDSSGTGSRRVGAGPAPDAGRDLSGRPQDPANSASPMAIGPGPSGPADRPAPSVPGGGAAGGPSGRSQGPAGGAGSAAPVGPASGAGPSGAADRPAPSVPGGGAAGGPSGRSQGPAGGAGSAAPVGPARGAGPSGAADRPAPSVPGGGAAGEPAGRSQGPAGGAGSAAPVDPAGGAGLSGSAGRSGRSVPGGSAPGEPSGRSQGSAGGGGVVPVSAVMEGAGAPGRGGVPAEGRQLVGGHRGPGFQGAGLRLFTPVTRIRPARVRVELATALRYLPGRLEEAAGQLARALEEAAGDPELRLAGLLCLARVHRARYARDADPAALEAAAEVYGRARGLVPRDGAAFAELLREWGDVLLERARASDGRRFVSTAVRVLRESRSAVPQSDPGSAHRLLRLAAGLRLRHAYEGDLVDLREAEYLLELAARQGQGPLDRARAWREHGDVQQEIHAHTRTADRLDRAADSYRRAWRAALEADREDRAGIALQLAVRVQELRGEVLERLARPRAALDAYRSALELWQRLDPQPPVPADPPHAPGPDGPEDTRQEPPPATRPDAGPGPEHGGPHAPAQDGPYDSEPGTEPGTGTGTGPAAPPGDRHTDPPDARPGQGAGDRRRALIARIRLLEGGT